VIFHLVTTITSCTCSIEREIEVRAILTIGFCNPCRRSFLSDNAEIIAGTQQSSWKSSCLLLDTLSECLSWTSKTKANVRGEL